MLQPKKTKHRKQQKGKIKGNAQRGHQIAFGSFGIKSLDEGFLTSRQIEELDKYVIASVIPSIVTMLFLAYTLEMFSLISSLIIILLSLILLF